MSAVISVQYSTISESSKDGIAGIANDKKIPEPVELRHTIVRKRRREIT